MTYPFEKDHYAGRDWSNEGMLDSQSKREEAQREYKAKADHFRKSVTDEELQRLIHDLLKLKETRSTLVGTESQQEIFTHLSEFISEFEHVY